MVSDEVVRMNLCLDAACSMQQVADGDKRSYCKSGLAGQIPAERQLCRENCHSGRKQDFYVLRRVQHRATQRMQPRLPPSKI